MSERTFRARQRAEAQATEYLNFAARVARESYPCKHGHLNCSSVDGGRCLDEAYATLSDDAREIVDL